MGPRPDQMFVFARNLRDGDHSAATTATASPGPGPGTGTGTPTAPDRIAIRADNNIVVSMIETRRPSGAAAGARVITRAGQFGGFDGRWVLMAKHRSGSLEAAVAGGAHAQPDGQLEHPDAADRRRSD